MTTIRLYHKVKKDYVNRANLAEPKIGVLFVDFINSTIWKKEKSFMRYIRTSKEEMAANLAGDSFYRR